MVLRDGNGQEVDFGGEFRELRPPEQFVWTFGFVGMPGEPGPEEYVFEERDGKTTVTTRADFGSKELRDQILQLGMQEGAAQSYDRLDEHLATLV